MWRRRRQVGDGIPSPLKLKRRIAADFYLQYQGRTLNERLRQRTGIHLRGIHDRIHMYMEEGGRSPDAVAHGDTDVRVTALARCWTDADGPRRIGTDGSRRREDDAGSGSRPGEERGPGDSEGWQLRRPRR